MKQTNRKQSKKRTFMVMVVMCNDINKEISDSQSKGIGFFYSNLQQVVFIPPIAFMANDYIAIG